MADMPHIRQCLTAMREHGGRGGGAGSSAICLSRARIPALIHSSRRNRIVVAEQVESPIPSYEQPNRTT